MDFSGQQYRASIHGFHLSTTIEYSCLQDHRNVTGG